MVKWVTMHSEAANQLSVPLAGGTKQQQNTSPHCAPPPIHCLYIFLSSHAFAHYNHSWASMFIFFLSNICTAIINVRRASSQDTTGISEQNTQRMRLVSTSQEKTRFMVT